MFSRLAIMNLLHSKLRSALMIAAMANVIMIIFFQIGLYYALKTEADKLYRKMRFDLVLVSHHYFYTRSTGNFPLQRLEQCRMYPQVESVIPLYMDIAYWRNARTGEKNPILVLAIPNHGEVFYDANLNEKMRDVQIPLNILFDRLSRPIFGESEIGMPAEINGKQITIAGEYRMGNAFNAPGTLMMNDDTFMYIFPGRTKYKVSIGLIRLAQGSDLSSIACELNSLLPRDTKVLTKEQLGQWEQNYWLKLTSIGNILTAGVLLVALIGMVVLYQIISTEIINHLPEYGTLKAMGYSNFRLAWIISQQVILLLSISFVVGFFLALILYHETTIIAHLEITMTAQCAFSVGLMILGMGAFVVFLSIQKLFLADPADVF